jgi:hypothetical protein
MNIIPHYELLQYMHDVISADYSEDPDLTECRKQSLAWLERKISSIGFIGLNRVLSMKNKK